MASQEDVKGQEDEELVEWGLGIEDGLTDWEMQFLESMNTRVVEGQQITATMRVKLEQIIREKG